jgi:hypothetical protein
MDSGDIYRHERFYRDAVTGELKPKFLVFLAPMAGGDWVARLLTSQSNLRTEAPRCSLGRPCPGYFLGVPGGPLQLRTWVDLRALADIDMIDFTRLEARGIVSRVLPIRAPMLLDLLECTAGALDTTRAQEDAIRDQLARLR